MRSRRYHTAISLLLLAFSASGFAQSQPNIVHIFADDLGFGSVGFNGQTQIQTPSLDALASGGMIFSNSYAATVCGPSRAMLYSGYHNGHTRSDRNSNLGGNSWDDDGKSVADGLGNAGYHTAVFGKWGFGGSGGGSGDLKPNPTVSGTTALPQNQGFDEFYGYLSHGRAHSYYVDSLWTTEQPAAADLYQANQDNGLWLENTGNTTATPSEAYTADLVLAKSLDYIQDRSTQADPFYMEFASTIPHFDIDRIRDQPNWFDQYASVPGSANWTDDQKSYAAMITRLDSAVGDIVDKLRDPNGDGSQADSLMANTLIMFSSDNGATPEDSSPITFFDANAPYRGNKRDLTEGGIHVPGLAFWEGTIAPGSTSDVYTDLADFAPTALELAGIESPVGLDGVSLAPTLTGQGIQRDRDYLVFEHHEGSGANAERWAIIRGQVKLIKFEDGHFEMYDLANDPTEQSQLNLSTTANLSLRDTLRDIALAEGVEQPDAYSVEHHTWTGSDGDIATDGSKWTANATPAAFWSAVMRNGAATSSVVEASGGLNTLGFEVSGVSARQTIRVPNARTVIGRNEVRIGDLGRVHLDNGNLQSNRWTDIYAGGALTGQGNIQGDIYNMGTVAPGLPADLTAPASGPQGVNTGTQTAIVFDFSGVQDNAPLTQTSVNNQYVEIVGGLDFGPGTSARGAADAGNEFNVQGWTVGGSLSNAISNSDYLTFSVAPVAGLEMEIDEVAFNVWRNGVNAPQNYAIMNSLNGFENGDELGSFSVATSGVSNQQTLTSVDASGIASAGPVEFRLYGWGAGGTNGNTHVNAVSLTASFTSIPNTPITPTGELVLDGDYRQLDTGLLEVQLGGLIQGVDYDVLRVNGEVVLDGTLDVLLHDPGTGLFAPQLGNSFTILTATSPIQGTFATTNLPSLAGGLAWQVDYNANSVSLTAIASGLACDAEPDGDCDLADIDALYAAVGTAGSFDFDGNGTVGPEDIAGWLVAASDPLNPALLNAADILILGDVDLDGDVNSTDLGLLLNNFSSTAGSAGSGVGWGGGDLDADGNVDSTDLGLLLNNFGSMSAAVAVPEPAGVIPMWLGVLSFVGLALRRR